MNRRFRIAATLTAVVALVAACTGPGATTTPTEAPMSEAPMSEAPMSEAPIAGGLLEKILNDGKIVVSTDPAYPPQSEQKPDGTYEGFDIDVAMALADSLGVELEWATPAWEVITAGSWAGRWDVSVGSMTITPERLEVLDFSVPYYFTPAQMAASTESGITTLEDLAGKTVCAGESTTYLQWLQGTLDFGPSGGRPDPPPAGVVATTLPTDRDCALQWQQGRFDFDGWLSSDTTVQLAIDDGLPLVKVGDPVYSEPLAVAADKSGPDPSDLLARLSAKISEMHADGTLSQLSIKWFGSDITKDPSS